MATRPCLTENTRVKRIVESDERQMYVVLAMNLRQKFSRRQATGCYIYSLDLGMTQESDGFGAGGSPEFSFGQVQRIVELDNWVELSSQSFKVGLGFLNSNRSTGVGGGRSKGRSRSDKGGENRCGLHFGIQQFV